MTKTMKPNSEIARELVNQNCGQTMGLQDLQSLEDGIIAALRAKDETTATALAEAKARIGELETRLATVVDYEKSQQAVRSVRDEARSKAFDDAIRESERVLGNINRQLNERSDGAFVALTRLVRNLKSIAALTTARDKKAEVDSRG